MSLPNKLAAIARPIISACEFIAPIADLALRVWVALVFWRSGVNKYESWDSTLMLFEYEYEVPFLSPEVAAYLGTTAELALPVLLIVGFGGRFAAAGLFVFNIVAVISYPALETAGILQHVMWGIMLALPVLHGPGKLSVDHLLRRRFMPN